MFRADPPTATSRTPPPGRRAGLLVAGGIGIAALAVAGAGSWLSCGGKSRAGAAHAIAAASSGDPAQGAAGAWLWSLVVEADGVRRIERERWELSARDGTVAGSYVREVFALSTDGEPFACNQALAYALRARYQVEGRADGAGLVLHETGYEVTPSPCERGFRTLGSYRGALERGALVLSWDGGRQRLELLLRIPVSAALTQSRHHRVLCVLSGS